MKIDAVVAHSTWKIEASARWSPSSQVKSIPGFSIQIRLRHTFLNVQSGERTNIVLLLLKQMTVTLGYTLNRRLRDRDIDHIDKLFDTIPDTISLLSL
jgi:hypothetical protein